MTEKCIDTTCRMCGTLCGITAHIENNKVTEIEGNPRHIFNKGRMVGCLCYNRNGCISIADGALVTEPIRRIAGSLGQVQ